MRDFDLRPSSGAQRRFRVEDGDAIEWTFAGDPQPAGAQAAGSNAHPHLAGRRPPGAAPASTNPYRALDGARRADEVRRALNEALEAWWRAQRLPDAALLREGLLVLEAGHALDETQRTLLARAALAHGLGIITALRHQEDAQRRAGLLREAVLDGVIGPAHLVSLRDDHRLDAGWLPILLRDLRADRYTPHADAAQRAADAVAALEWQPPEAAADDFDLEPAVRRRSVPSMLVATLLVLAALGALWWLRLRPPDYGDVIAVPGGVYTVSADADGAFSGQIRPRRVEVAPFIIDRTEVTNAQYRACYADGACAWPRSADSATRTNYLLDNAFAEFPVLWVDWEGARRFCAWRGMRLPSAEEWEVAATYAPATGRYYRYPWGHAWDPARVVGGGGFVDTAAVGSRSPQGDSPLGAADMSGNVAEWTSSDSTSHPELAMIRGGSWRSSPRDLLPTTLLLVRKASASNTLGFRCAVSQ